jgi:endo-1,4-beta-xylanase
MQDTQIRGPALNPGTATAPLCLLAITLAACSEATGPATLEDALSAAGAGTPHVVEVTGEDVDVMVGWEMQLTAVLRNPGGDPVDGRQTLVWTSEDEGVATVDETGRVTGASLGTTTVTATFTDWDKAGSFELEVVPETLGRLASMRDVHIGAALAYQAGAFPSHAPYVETLREFNGIVGENIQKWFVIRRGLEGDPPFRLHFGDELLDFAEANRGMRARGHTLGWHANNPAWLTDLQPETTSREEAIALLEEHIEVVAGHWKGRIAEWDVANEVIRDGATGPIGSPTDRRPASEHVWERLIGPDWVDIAFHAAAKADPDALLFYNDYSIEAPFSNKQNRVYHLVVDLLDRGVPIHGVGFQSHFSIANQLTEEELIESIDRFWAHGLKVQITELDIGVPADQQNEAGFASQAEYYRRVVKVCVEHPACDTVIVWGVDDGNSWRAAQRPLLFDADFSPKPAYFAVLDYLAGR